MEFRTKAHGKEFQWVGFTNFFLGFWRKCVKIPVCFTTFLRGSKMGKAGVQRPRRDQKGFPHGRPSCGLCQKIHRQMERIT